MTSALRWAVVTTVLTIVAISVPLSMASKRADQPEWARGAILVAILGVPLAGGVISLAKGTADRRAGRSPGQTRAAIGLGIALVTLGLALFYAMASVMY